MESAFLRGGHLRGEKDFGIPRPGSWGGGMPAPMHGLTPSGTAEFGLAEDGEMGQSPEQPQ